MIKEYLKVIGLGLIWLYMNWKSLVFYAFGTVGTLVALFEGGVLSALFVFVALWGVYKLGKLF